MDNNQSIYFTGNLHDSDQNSTLGGSTTAPLPGYQGGGTILTSPWSTWTTSVSISSPASAFRRAISIAGALPHDQIDALVLSQMQTLGSGTVGTGAGTAGPDGSFYTSQAQTGLGNNGYGTIAGGTKPFGHGYRETIDGFGLQRCRLTSLMIHRGDPHIAFGIESAARRDDAFPNMDDAADALDGDGPALQQFATLREATSEFVDL